MAGKVPGGGWKGSDEVWAEGVALGSSGVELIQRRLAVTETFERLPGRRADPTKTGAAAECKRATGTRDSTMLLVLHASPANPAPRRVPAAITIFPLKLTDLTVSGERESKVTFDTHKQVFALPDRALACRDLSKRLSCAQKRA